MTPNELTCSLDNHPATSLAVTPGVEVVAHGGEVVVEVVVEVVNNGHSRGCTMGRGGVQWVEVVNNGQN